MRKDISDCLGWTVIETNDGYIVHDVGMRSAASKIRTYAGVIHLNVGDVDKWYPDVKAEIKDKIVKRETDGIYRTWEEYRRCLVGEYHLNEDLTDTERADKIIEDYVEMKTK